MKSSQSFRKFWLGWLSKLRHYHGLHTDSDSGTQSCGFTSTCVVVGTGDVAAWYATGDSEIGATVPDIGLIADGTVVDDVRSGLERLEVVLVVGLPSEDTGLSAGVPCA